MIFASAIVPHPPILIPQIGKDNLSQLKSTITAYKKLAKYLEEKRGMIIVHSRESCKTMDASYLPDVVWLPRQDQLQEIIAPPYSSQHSIYGLPHTFARFVEFSDGQASDYIQQFHSMEQLWLAFVMKERWNKTWNGNEWVCPG